MSEIKKPKKGTPVWTFVNGRPGLRYYHHKHNQGHVLCFSLKDCKKDSANGKGYFTYYGNFYTRESDVLNLLAQGALNRLFSASAELDLLCKELRQVLAKENKKN